MPDFICGLKISYEEFEFLWDLCGHGWNWTNHHWRNCNDKVIDRLERLGFVVRGEAGSWKPTERAMEFMEEAADDDNPFNLNEKERASIAEGRFADFT